MLFLRFALLYGLSCNLGAVDAASVTKSFHTSDPADACVSSPRISWFNRARDELIRLVWSVTSDPSSCSRPRQPKAPSTLSAHYGGDLVLRFSIKSEQEAQALTEAVRVLLLDVWNFTPEWVDIRLSKDVLPSLLGLLPENLQTAHTPLMHDLAQVILESYPSQSPKEPSTLSTNQPPTPFSHGVRATNQQNNIFFRQYQPLSVIVPWMRLLRSLFPTHVRLINIGMSYEGRDIYALRVGVHPTNDEQPFDKRKTILVTGGSHAREWISTSTVTYLAYSFITAYGRSRDITKLLEKFDFVFIPTMNPDGYVYTWETDRLWRKNRQQTPLRFCQGLDLDRSFSYQWDGVSDPVSPCSESYSGAAPFEAVESVRLADWAKNETKHNNVEFAAFLDFHSYSQQVLFPYAFSCTSAPPTLENLEEVAIGLAKAIRTATGETYGVTSACEGNIPAKCEGTNQRDATTRTQRSKSWSRVESGGGSALDWFHHELKVPYAYQIKLRDTGTYGFLLPSVNIIPTGKEAFKAVEHLANFLAGDKGVEAVARSQDIHDAANLYQPKPTEAFHVNERGSLGYGKTLQHESGRNPNELKK